MMVGRNFAQVNGLLEPGFWRETLHPEAKSFLGPRHREEDYGFESARESFIQILALVGGKNCNRVERLNALQEKRDFLIGVAIVRIFGFAPLAEKSIGLVEEKDPTLVLGLVENAGQIFLGFTNVFRDDQGEINVVDLPARGLAEQAGGHGFARPWRAVEKGAISGAQFGRHSPLVHEGFTVPDPDLDFPDLPESAGGQHKVGPVQLCLDVAGWEVGAQIRPARVTRCKESEILVGEAQRAFQHGFVPTLWYESQNIVLR